MQLPILYCDNSIVAINKPSGLLVHRSNIDKHETQFALQTLRDQLGRRVYPLHRLDKPTSGVLLFAFDAEMTRRVAGDWGDVDKSYLAITRGRLHSTVLNHPVKTLSELGVEKIQQAETVFNLLATTEVPVVFGRRSQGYTHTVFSLVQAQIKTGRKHQIRKHLKHLNHPIVGDTRYGRGEVNRHFREWFGVNRLMLHCQWMRLRHPVTQKTMVFFAPVDVSWLRMMHAMQWNEGGRWKSMVKMKNC